MKTMSRIRICDELRITEFSDDIIKIESLTSTGYLEGEILIIPEELPILIKALQEIQNKRSDTESK